MTIDWATMDNRARDALIEQALGIVWNEARCRICGWPLRDDGCQPGDCAQRPRPTRRADEPAPYTSNYTACRVVEDAIEQRGLQDAYVKALLDLVAPDPSGIGSFWQIVRAHLDYRCQAALVALGVL